jgi:hypothetical protein
MRRDRGQITCGRGQSLGIHRLPSGGQVKLKPSAAVSPVEGTGTGLGRRLVFWRSNAEPSNGTAVTRARLKWRNDGPAATNPVGTTDVPAQPRAEPWRGLERLGRYASGRRQSQLRRPSRGYGRQGQAAKTWSEAATDLDGRLRQNWLLLSGLGGSTPSRQWILDRRLDEVSHQPKRDNRD